MTKERLLKLYIADLTNLVKDSDARGNRLAMLEDELEKEQEQVNVTLCNVIKCDCGGEMEEKVDGLNCTICG